MAGARIGALAIGYLCGLFLSGFFLGKSKDVDLRTKGSGNVGTTNTMRILGLKMGAITLLCDCLKSILAVWLVWLLFSKSYEEHIVLLELYGAIGAVLGHDFPVYMKFKGGKGIAASFGMLIAIYPGFLPCCVLIFVLAVAVTKYVSLGSILAALAVIIQVFVFDALGWLPFAPKDTLEAQVLTVFVAVLAIFLHRSNISRLLHGTENKLSFQSKRE